jgi:hypothetical protein
MSMLQSMAEKSAADAIARRAIPAQGAAVPPDLRLSWRLAIAVMAAASLGHWRLAVGAARALG